MGIVRNHTRKPRELHEAHLHDHLQNVFGLSGPRRHDTYVHCSGVFMISLRPEGPEVQIEPLVVILTHQFCVNLCKSFQLVLTYYQQAIGIVIGIGVHLKLPPGDISINIITTVINIVTTVNTINHLGNSVDSLRSLDAEVWGWVARRLRSKSSNRAWYKQFQFVWKRNFQF